MNNHELEMKCKALEKENEFVKAELERYQKALRHSCQYIISRSEDTNDEYGTSLEEWEDYYLHYEENNKENKNE